MQSCFFGISSHRFALTDVVRHQLFRQHVLAALHRLDRNRCMQEQRQGDDDCINRLVIQQRFHPAVRLIVNGDLFASLGFRSITVLLDQTGPSRQCRVAGPVAMKRAMNAARADICNRLHLHIVRCATADQHVTFVADADDSNPHRIVHLVAVSKVHRTQASPRDDAGADHAFDEVAAGHTDSFVVVVLTDLALFRSKRLHD